MIEKLDLDNGYATVDWLPTQHGKRCGAKEIQTTVNQLIDAVNVLQAQVAILQEHAHPTATTENSQSAKITQGFKNLQDLYAEQRKWIGKLCKFWDDSDKPENCVYDILCNIFDLSHHEDCPFQCGNGEWYEYCEPVKPDDNIIYKGEQ